jgi:hypothetical protein
LDIVLEYAEFLFQSLLLLVIMGSVGHGDAARALLDSLGIAETVQGVVAGAAARTDAGEHDDLGLLTSDE